MSDDDWGHYPLDWDCTDDDGAGPDDDRIVALIYEIGRRGEGNWDTNFRALYASDLRDDGGPQTEDAARAAYRNRIQRRNQERGGRHGRG